MNRQHLEGCSIVKFWKKKDAAPKFWSSEIKTCRILLKPSSWWLNHPVVKNHWKHHLPIQLDALRYVLWIHKPWGSLKTWRLSHGQPIRYKYSMCGGSTWWTEAFQQWNKQNSDHESLFNPKTSAAISSYLNQTAKFRGSVHNVSSDTFFFELWAYHGVSLVVTYALETSLSKKSTRSLDASDSFEQ